MEGFKIQRDELAENPSPRCACVVTVDTSGSMSGQPIAELNEGMRLFYEEIRQDEIAKLRVEPGIVSFSTHAEVVAPIGPIDHNSPPPTLKANGSTALGAGISLALDIIEEAKWSYKSAGISYYQPWLVLMTDGQPTDEWRHVAQRVHELSRNRKLSFFGIGIGASADMEVLKQICPPNRPPVRLKGIKFREFFEWLSASLSIVGSSATGSSAKLPDHSGWSDIFV